MHVDHVVAGEQREGNQNGRDTNLPFLVALVVVEIVRAEKPEARKFHPLAQEFRLKILQPDPRHRRDCGRLARELVRHHDVTAGVWKQLQQRDEIRPRKRVEHCA